MLGSDIVEASGLKSVVDPYGGSSVVVVPRLQPDWAILHVQEADCRGNARILGSVFWDRLAARASSGVILTAERIVSSQELARQPELSVIPSLFVQAVVEAPRGAAPCSCAPFYDIDRQGVEGYLETTGDRRRLRRYLDEMDQELRDRAAPRAIKARGGKAAQQANLADQEFSETRSVW